jgi:hypothetical protein
VRATAITSLITGLGFGALVVYLDPASESAEIAVILTVFFTSTAVGVIGIPQIREMHAERKRRGQGAFGVLARHSDFSTYYLPTWGRMFLWFIASGVGGYLVKTFA